MVISMAQIPLGRDVSFDSNLMALLMPVRQFYDLPRSKKMFHIAQPLVKCFIRSFENHAPNSSPINKVFNIRAKWFTIINISHGYVHITETFATR